MRKVIRTKPYIPDSDVKWINESWNDILTSGNFIQGKYVKLLEERFAEYCGTKYAIATSSGASALEVAIRAVHRLGNTIVVQSNTFPASVNAIIRAGYTPLISDIDPYTMSMSYKTLMDTLNGSYPAAIMLVHMAGLVNPDYYKIKGYCMENGVFLFEDASHAVGSKIGNISEVFNLVAIRD